MGQGEVLDFLKTQKEPLTGGEIAHKMKQRRDKISRILTKLVKKNDVSYIEIDREQAKRRCNACHRIILYYVQNL